MPERSNLRLTPEEEKELVEYLIQRLPEIERDNEERHLADRKSHRDYANSKDYRAKSADSVFNHENLSLPMTSMVVDSFAARSEEEITGSAPFFHTKAKGSFSTDASMSLDRLLHYRLNDESNLREKTELSFHPAFVQRAVIFKAIYHEEWDEYEDSDALVLYDNEAGDYVMFVSKETGEEEIRYVVYGSESWIDDLGPNPMTGELDLPIHRLEDQLDIVLSDEEYNAEPGDEILLQTKYSWQPIPETMTRRELLEKGAKTALIDSDHFYAPSNVATLDDADYLLEVYDRPVEWVERRWLDAPGRDKWKDVEWTFKHGDATPKTEGEREGKSKEDLQFDHKISSRKIHEFWIKRDVKGKGRPQRICIFIDVEAQKAIYYEYAAKMVPHPKMRHPFTAVAPCRTSDTWCDRSLVEMLESFQDFIDLHWNRWSYRNAIATNPLIFYNADKTRDKKTFMELKPFEVIEPDGDYTMQEILEAFVFPQAEQNTKDLIDRVLHMIQLRFGISNLAQGDYSDIPENTTAYGMDATLREAGKLSRRWSRRLIRAIADHIEKLAYIELATMDDKVAVPYVDGDEETLQWITRESVENLEAAVDVIISKQSSQATVEANRLVEEIADKYASRDPVSRKRIRPLYVSSLRALGYDNAEDLLPRVTDEELAAYAEMLDAEQAALEEGEPPPDEESQRAKPPKTPPPVRE